MTIQPVSMIMTAWLRAVLVAVMLVTVGLPVLAQKRVALVVGVSDYQHVPRLTNPGNDAREVARRLERFGFQVERLSGQTVGKRELDDALVRLRQRAAQAEAVVVFFAGHGIEIGGQNYLLPSDARLLDERDVRREAVALDDLLAELRSEKPNRVNVVILDACRENPFRSRLAASGRSVSRGLGRPDVRMNGTLIAFSTAANDVAADGGNAPHSPYTQALLDVMDREPQLEIGLFFRRVRAQVLQRAPTQQPWEHGSLLGEFYFANPFAPITPSNRDAVEDAAWRLCESGATAVPCDDYLSGWPQGRYAALARTRLRDRQAAAASQSVQQPSPQPGTAQTACAQCPEMVAIAAGRFQMGSTDGEGDEKPVRVVTVPAFELGRTEVTQGQWMAVMGSNPSRFQQCGDECPVENVSWKDVQEYLKRLNQQTGRNYRLPSEAEWEYAARAGGTGRWSFGDVESQLGEHAWYSANSGNRTRQVGEKRPNAFGVYDMYGNVWEWVQDAWHDNYVGAPTDGSAWTRGGDQAARVVRGGGLGNSPEYVRSSDRARILQGDRYDGTGFRVARTL